MYAVNNLPLVVAILACVQLLAVAMIIFDDHPTRYEARMEKKRKRALAPYKRNVLLRLDLLKPHLSQSECWMTY